MENEKVKTWHIVGGYICAGLAAYTINGNFTLGLLIFGASFGLLSAVKED